MGFSIEAAVRTAFSWTLVRLFAASPPVPIPDWHARPYKILFIRDDGIGDLMVSMELIRAIAEVSPQFTVDLLCSPSNAAFGRSLPFVRDVIVHKRGAFLASWPVWRDLRSRGYDVVIDGRAAIGNVNKHTQALMLATGAPWRVGLGGRRNDRVYNVPVRLDPVDHWIHSYVALGQPFGIAQDSRDWRARLPLSDAERSAAERTWNDAGGGRPRVLVNLYSASSDRQWPVDQFGELLLALRQRLPQASIILPTMPGGDAESSRIATPAGARAVPLSLAQVTAVTASAHLVVSPDTAVTVIASAFRVPILALMRKGTGQWEPYRMTGRIAFSDDARSLRALPTARVVGALDEIIAEQRWR
ncbi:MAG TPA: glycosyltransferase family 9 protein [Gemmatimonadaceae bacterium]